MNKNCLYVKNKALTADHDLLAVVLVVAIETDKLWELVLVFSGVSSETFQRSKTPWQSFNIYFDKNSSNKT